MIVKNMIYFLILSLAIPIAFADCGFGGGFGSMMWPFGIGFGFSGLILMVAFWALVIWLIVWAINRYSKKENPLDILKKRYAKGEINKKQFENMKRELR